MKHFSLTYIFALALAFFFVACGDDESSFAPRDDESSSSIEEESSSSSVTLSGASAESNGSSSSSAKSSSSTDAKSSSSVTSSSSGTSAGSSAGTNSSSGEEKRPCSEEGKTQRANGVKVICHDGFWVPESSSSAVPTSSYFDMTEQFNEKVSYGEFTDLRDGHKYRTVSMYDDTFERTYVIFAENLNYGKMVSGGTVQGDSTKYCYDDDSWYCENGWGGLYTWSNAMGFPAVCDSVSIGAEACSQKFVYPSGYGQPQNYVQHQGICPEGWHIMNSGEWAYLDQRTGGSAAHYMGSKVAGFGNNDYGLSILPTGYWIDYGNEHNKFDEIKVQSQFWMPQQADTDLKAYMTSVSRTNFSRNFPVSKNYGNSIRCVKNY